MVSFIRPLPNHWKPADFDLSSAAVGEPVRHIAKTVCLLESRCDDYADYLRAIFRDRSQGWRDAVDQWNSEECQHGEQVRLLGESADPMMLDAVREAAAEDPRIVKVLRALTVQQGPGEVMLACKLQFQNDLTTPVLVGAINEFEQRLQKRVPDIKWCFVEPDSAD